MTETAAEQRTRILRDCPEDEPWEYDLALKLGYQPESWDGMYRLPPHPFTILDGHVIVREVATEHGRAKINGNRVIHRVHTQSPYQSVPRE
jgi:hypothetical protein